MEDTVFSPKEWQTTEIPSSLNSIDQVEDREMARRKAFASKISGAALVSVFSLPILAKYFLHGQPLRFAGK